MAWGNDLPISESIGVFFGLTGLDWLTEGRAEPVKAAVVAVAAGAVLFIAREIKRRRKG